MSIAEEKTEWATTRTTFLGVLYDGESQVLSILEEKRFRAVELLNIFVQKRKATVKDMQCLAGYLNFLMRAIFPGQTFTRRMYVKFNSKSANLRSYHHVKLDREFKADCWTWLDFLQCDQNNQNNLRKTVCHPWVDLSANKQAPELYFFTDSSGGLTSGGMGGVFGESWFKAQWDKDFLAMKKPSIAYLELFALVSSILIWKD